MPVAVGSRVFLVQGLRWELSGRPEHPHWLANICAGLADVGIDVVGGHAARERDGSWRAHVDVDVTRAVVDPENVDVAAFAGDRPWPVDLEPLRLRQVDVGRRDDGLLVVRLSGEDQPGFLARLLRQVSLLGLEPVEVAGTTRTGLVQLRLVLADRGDAPPDAELVGRLQHLLSCYLVPGRP